MFHASAEIKQSLRVWMSQTREYKKGKKIYTLIFIDKQLLF